MELLRPMRAPETMSSGAPPCVGREEGHHTTSVARCKYQIRDNFRPGKSTVTETQRRRQLKKVLDNHNAMIRHVESDNDLSAHILRAMKDLIAAVDKRYGAQRRFLIRLYRANTAALTLWHDDAASKHR